MEMFQPSSYSEPRGLGEGPPRCGGCFTEAWRSDDEEPIEVVGDQVIWPQGTILDRVKVGM